MNVQPPSKIKPSVPSTPALRPSHTVSVADIERIRRELGWGLQTYGAAVLPS